MGKDVDDKYMKHIRDQQRAIAKAMADILGGVEYLPDAFQKLLKEAP